VSDVPRILLVHNGPYIVTGGVPIVRLVRDADGAWTEGEPLESRDRYALCRCGGSTTKPFFDEGGSCREAGEATVRVPRPVGWDVPGSRPLIAIKPDGPLRVRGVELSADDGTAFEPADRFSLCRCGRSNTMPFCDGSHKEVGFRG
jgi:CDGSH-type Zn-finger protein